VIAVELPHNSDGAVEREELGRRRGARAFLLCRLRRKTWLARDGDAMAEGADSISEMLYYPWL
jgi:hypothetical protein